MISLKRTGPPESVVYVTNSYFSDQQPGRNDDLDDVKIPAAYTSLVDAVAAIGAAKGTIIVDLPYSLAANLTIPADVSLVITPRGSVTVASGKTLTINGPLANFAATPFAGAGAVAYGAAATRNVVGPASMSGKKGKVPTINATEDGFDWDIQPATLSFFIDNPSVKDYGAIKIIGASTITGIHAYTEGGGTETVDFNLEERDAATPNTAGADVLSADLQADHDGASVTSGFGNSGLADGCWLSLAVSAVANSPTRLCVTVTLKK